MHRDKEKLIKLFEFLKQYNDIKNPTILDIEKQKWTKNLEYIPNHPNIVNNIYDTDETDIILSVKKPELKNCPHPPKDIESWIDGDWKNPKIKIKNKNTKEIKKQNYGEDNTFEYITINFDDDSKRVKEFNEWKEIREEWSKEEVETRECDDLYNELFSLYSNLKKEPEGLELVFGDGNLFARGSKNEFVNHPILLQTIKLDFNANIPEFSLVIGDKEPELYKTIFNLDGIKTIC